jgi:hypothetical protein
MQVGMVGYGQWQTTDKAGPDVTPVHAETRYSVNALGLSAAVVWPTRTVSLGFRYFKEFSSRSTFQGYSAQVFEHNWLLRRRDPNNHEEAALASREAPASVTIQAFDDV